MSNFVRRLAKIERRLVDLEQAKMLAQCTCPERTFGVSLEPEQFEAEMNRSCPAHEFRHLGNFFVVYCEPDGPEQEALNSRFDQLLAEYERRPHRLRVSSESEK